MKIQSTVTYGLDRLKILVYGSPGVGKTTLAATICESTLVVSAESGLLSLAGRELDYVDLSLDDKGNVVPKEARIDRLKEIYEWLQTDEPKKKYKWIFLDSLTEVSQNLLEKLFTLYPDRKDSLVLYGENSKIMRSLIKSFRDLPYNVVMTALSENDKDESGRTVTGVSMPGRMSQNVPAFFDEVFFLFTDANGVRHFQTEPTDRIVAKDRSGALEKIEKPDIAQVTKKIRDHKTKKESK